MFSRIPAESPKKSLYLCRLDQLRDPSTESLTTFLKELPKTFFVNCWHENTTESAAFWDQYSNSRGLAIRSTVGRLKESCQAAMNVFIARVKYIDYETPQPGDIVLDMLSPAFLKRQSFEHEREVRVLKWELPLMNEKMDWTAAKASVELAVDLSVLIEAVYISPTSPEWLAAPVQDLFAQFGLPDIPIRRSNLYDRSID